MPENKERVKILSYSYAYEWCLDLFIHVSVENIIIITLSLQINKNGLERSLEVASRGPGFKSWCQLFSITERISQVPLNVGQCHLTSKITRGLRVGSGCYAQRFPPGLTTKMILHYYLLGRLIFGTLLGSQIVLHIQGCQAKPTNKMMPC